MNIIKLGKKIYNGKIYIRYYIDPEEIDYNTFYPCSACFNYQLKGTCICGAIKNKEERDFFLIPMNYGASNIPKNRKTANGYWKEETSIEVLLEALHEDIEVL